MDIRGIDLSTFSCGIAHAPVEIDVEIGPGLLRKTAEILAHFPKRILVVADTHSLAASAGLLENLQDGGFDCGLQCYEECTEANILLVEEVEKLAEPYDGVLAVGSGSIHDICRLASFRAKRAFALFATAASMDGFASNSAPIIFGHFKESVLCHVPSVIIGDTEILAKAPEALKAAGFSDILAKYVALVDWQIAALVSEEIYCPEVARLVKDALERSVALADRVAGEDPAVAGAMMEALVLSGVSMAFTQNTRPASGAEHMLSHYWEIKKLERQEAVAFHGQKVGVGTLMIAKLYHLIADQAYGVPVFQEDATDWEGVYQVYGAGFRAEIERLNHPSVIEETSPEILQRNWPEICRLIHEELPSYEVLLGHMQAAHAITSIEGIGVDEQLALDGLRYHPYMRHRIILTRLIPMLGIQPDYEALLA